MFDDDGRCVDPRNLSPSGDIFTAWPVVLVAVGDCCCFDFDDGLTDFVFADLLVDKEEFDRLLLPVTPPPLLRDVAASLSCSRFALGRDVLRLLNLRRLKDGIIR